MAGELTPRDDLRALADRLDGEVYWTIAPTAPEQRKVVRETAEALRALAAAQQTPQEPLGIVLAQLRHAYHNLIGPDVVWDREKRMRFADGLIAPQIVKLERLVAHQQTIDSGSVGPLHGPPMTPVPSSAHPSVPNGRDSGQSEAGRTVASIAAMLGWINVPPRETLERDIAALKARVAHETPAPRPADARKMCPVCGSGDWSCGH